MRKESVGISIGNTEEIKRFDRMYRTFFMGIFGKWLIYFYFHNFQDNVKKFLYRARRAR